MKPRTLARIALKYIEDGSFIFDTEARKQEAIRQMRLIVSGKPTVENNPTDPIVELHIGVHIPNFDYPLVPTDNNGNPVIWQEDNKYDVSACGTHIVKGISVKGETYLMSFLNSLAPFRNTVIKVDRYTDVKRAAHALVCSTTNFMNNKTQTMTDQPIKMEYDAILEEWNTHEDVKIFEKEQHKLYIKWLAMWIDCHGRNPDTHMRVLKPIKKSN